MYDIVCVGIRIQYCNIIDTCIYICGRGRIYLDRYKATKSYDDCHGQRRTASCVHCFSLNFPDPGITQKCFINNYVLSCMTEYNRN